MTSPSPLPSMTSPSSLPNMTSPSSLPSMTTKERYIANCNRVKVEDSIDSNEYNTILTRHSIIVDSVKRYDQCTHGDKANYIKMIQRKIKERQETGLVSGVSNMEAYIDKILNAQISMFLLATAKFKFIELTPNHCIVEMKMHRWTKRPSTVYQMIRIMLYCVYKHWKITIDSLTVRITLTSSAQQRAFLSMGFRPIIPGTNINMQLDWTLYTQLHQTPACVNYIYKLQS